MEGKSDLLDLTNSIDEDEEPVDTDTDTDTDTDEQEKTSLHSSVFTLPEEAQEPDEITREDIPGIVIPEDIIDIPKMSPKVKLRKKPTCQPSFSNSQASRHSMKEIHDAVFGTSFLS